MARPGCGGAGDMQRFRAGRGRYQRSPRSFGPSTREQAVSGRLASALSDGKLRTISEWVGRDDHRAGGSSSGPQNGRPRAARTEPAAPLTGVVLGYAALAFGELAVSPRGGPHPLRLRAGAMDIAESLADLLCHVRVAFMFFGSLLVSLSRSLGGAHGAQAGFAHTFAGLIAAHSSLLPA